MKKKITSVLFALVTLITTSAFVAKYQTGIAGYTASPGEPTCNACHGGGNSAVSGTSISATPSFTNNEYIPGQNYIITITTAASGFSRFGFGCEILNENNDNAGSMHTQGAGVKFLFAGSRKNAVHTSPKVSAGSADFTFEWTAPTGGDVATIYVAGNAVNGSVNGAPISTSGDFPLTPISLQLNPPPPTQEPLGINENKVNALTQLSVYPNPASVLTNVSYFLSTTQPVHIELISLTGALIKDFTPKTQFTGPHSQILDLQGVASGIYFVKVSVNGQKNSQKLISIQ